MLGITITIKLCLKNNPNKKTLINHEFGPVRMNNNLQSAIQFYLAESHVSVCPPNETHAGPSIWLAILSAFTPAQHRGKINSPFLFHLTAGLWPVPCLLWFTLLKAVTIYFLTFGGHFSSDPSCSPLFLLLPLLACTPGFFWLPQLRQQYKAWVA